MPDPFSFKLTYDRNLAANFSTALKSRLGLAIAKLARDAEGRMKVSCPVDTGFLKSSILATKVEPMLWQIVVGASYGIYVEMGTVRMTARPYFMPAMLAIEPVFVQLVAQAIQQAAAEAARGGSS